MTKEEYDACSGPYKPPYYSIKITNDPLHHRADLIDCCCVDDCGCCCADDCECCGACRGIGCCTVDGDDD